MIKISLIISCSKYTLRRQVGRSKHRTEQPQCNSLTSSDENVVSD